jgi:hypothetical protein
MSDFLSLLAARTLGAVATIQPRLPSLYEPPPHAVALPPPPEVASEQREVVAERAEERKATPRVPDVPPPRVETSERVETVVTATAPRIAAPARVPDTPLEAAPPAPPPNAETVVVAPGRDVIVDRGSPIRERIERTVSRETRITNPSVTVERNEPAPPQRRQRDPEPPPRVTVAAAPPVPPPPPQRLDPQPPRPESRVEPPARREIATHSTLRIETIERVAAPGEPLQSMTTTREPPREPERLVTPRREPPREPTSAPVRVVVESRVAPPAMPVVMRPPSQQQQRESESAAPDVHVTIGRVEVRAVTPPAAPPRERAASRPGLMSLDDYLRRRGEKATR